MSCHISALQYRQLVRAKLFIDAEFCNPLSLSDIAREAGLSPFHFHRLFSQAFRISPHQYLTAKRIARAMTWLREGRTVSEVCYGVGFESRASFTRLFRKKVRLTPRNFQQTAIKRVREQKAQPKKFVPHCFLENYPGKISKIG